MKINPSMTKDEVVLPFKITESDLVVIHTPALDVLLIERADHHAPWQSVAGSKDFPGESLVDTAGRKTAQRDAYSFADGSNDIDRIG